MNITFTLVSRKSICGCKVGAVYVQRPPHNDRKVVTWFPKRIHNILKLAITPGVPFPLAEAGIMKENTAQMGAPT